MREIEQAMSLLFFGQGTNVGIYKVRAIRGDKAPSCSSFIFSNFSAAHV